ncbi:MAG TPA: hypothetical protein VG737_14975 [Cyclobacteriaceae bacterium]|nr:hypothetical protein [Cyclobacteriaceae bacterium]
MSLINAIILGLFILFCIVMIYGTLSNHEEQLSKRIGCAAPFVLFIVLIFFLGTMNNQHEMRELRFFFGIASFVNIALGSIFRGWDGDDARPWSVSRDTWRGTIGNVFLLVAAVCFVSFMVLVLVLNDPDHGPTEPPEPIVFIGLK